MSLDSILKQHVFSSGKTEFTVQSTLVTAALVVLFAFLARLAHRYWLKRLSKLEPNRRGALESLSRFVYYFVLAVGIMLVLMARGLDLTTLTLLTSALGIGIGFGLQSITSNLISGIIILFERPIKVGDRIEVGGVAGDVVAISIRASTILTNNNIAIIVPNSDFITQRITNWSFTDRNVRFHINVGVSYASDPAAVKEALLSVAASHPGVLKDPHPDVMFEEFADSSLNFALRVWTHDYTSRPGVLKSELNYLIFECFKERGIEIPFPQRDVHIYERKLEN
jgi:small-conductance mechanosensitive channel